MEFDKQENISKEALKDAKKQMNVYNPYNSRREQTFHLNKCSYCGKNYSNEEESFHKKCKKIMDNQLKERKKRGLCGSCGEPLLQKRFHKDTCDVCVGVINLLMDKVKELGKKVKEEK